MLELKPKLSRITGKCIHFGVLEIIGHLQLDSYFFVTLENEHHDVVAIRDIFGIKDWIKERKELVSALKKRNIQMYFRPISKEELELSLSFTRKAPCLLSLIMNRNMCL